MPSRTDMAGHTKALVYPVMDHGGGESTPAQGRFMIRPDNNHGLMIEQK